MRVRYRLDDGSVAVSEFDSLEYSKDYKQATFYNSYAKNIQSVIVLDDLFAE